jgi:hypothetical protein
MSHIDSKTFKYSLSFLKTTNEVIEIFLNISPQSYKQELAIARDILVHQNYKICMAIEDLKKDSKDIPVEFKDLFFSNSLLINLINVLPIGKIPTEPHKVKKVKINGDQSNAQSSN